MLNRPFFKGVTLWNNLPLDIQIIDTAVAFKNAAKTHLNIF